MCDGKRFKWVNEDYGTKVLHALRYRVLSESTGADLGVLLTPDMFPMIQALALTLGYGVRLQEEYLVETETPEGFEVSRC